MAKKHLKRLAMPKSWQIRKKEAKFITRPKPGAHSLKLGMPLLLMIRDILGYGKTKREVDYIVNNKEVLVDAVRRKDSRFGIGLMDVISLPQLKQHWRVLLDKKGKISFIEIDNKEANIKLCKIIGKTAVRKKFQLNLHDGKNILVDKSDFKVGDSLLLDLPSLKIKDHLKLEKGALIFLIKGKHIGETSIVEKIERDRILCNSEGSVLEAPKESAFVIGKGKAVIATSKS